MTLLSSDQYQSPSMIYPYNQDQIGSPNRLRMFLNRLRTTDTIDIRKGLKLKHRLGPPVNQPPQKCLPHQPPAVKDARQIINQLKAGPQNKAGPPEVIQKPPTFPQLHQYQSSGSLEENLLNEDPDDYYFE
jgi:hypothetical protein